MLGVGCLLFLTMAALAAATTVVGQAVTLKGLSTSASSSSSLLKSDASEFFCAQKLNLSKGYHSSLRLRSNVGAHFYVFV